MSEITMDALIEQTAERLGNAHVPIADLERREADILYFRGVLAILLGYRAVADVLEAKK